MVGGSVLCDTCETVRLPPGSAHTYNGTFTRSAKVWFFGKSRLLLLELFELFGREYLEGLLSRLAQKPLHLVR